MKLGEDHHQVIVIGTGAGGAAAAWALTTAGIKVLALEAGPNYIPEQDYILDKPQWERQRFPLKPGSQGSYSFAQMQELEQRWNTLRSWNINIGKYNKGKFRIASGPGYHHVQGVGGSTLHFTGEAHRLNPESMKMESDYGVAADWPLSYSDIEPFYNEAETIIGVAGPEANEIRWRSKPYPLPPHPLSKASLLVQKTGAAHGFNWTENARAALSENYDGRPACNYCANCNRGCPRRDKGSTDVTFIHKALETDNLDLRSECKVIKIIQGSGNQVRSIEYINKEGRKLKVTCDILILATGAIETPRLLLASSNKDNPDGIANESHLVGRNLMETLFWNSSGLANIDLDSFKGLPSDSICWDYNHPKSIKNTIGGCRFSLSTAEADLVGPINYANRVVPGWGLKHKKALRNAFGKIVTVGAIGEFLPNKKTFIDLDHNKRDRHGIPLARIHSHLPEKELIRLEFMMHTCRKILKIAGITSLAEEYGSYDFFNSTHVFGTCRMGRDPMQSVVNEFGQSHTWKNLFICDASIFPSSGGGESPSLTIEALAIRTGRHISKILSS